MADDIRRPLRAKAMMELIGTGLLVGTVQMARMTVPDVVGRVAFATVTCLTYMGFELSGAHYNPAITFTFMLRNKCAPRAAALYIAMQTTGGIVGALCARNMCHKSSSLDVGEGYSWEQAALAEIMTTTILCLTVLTIALRRHFEVHPIYGVAIASVIYAGNAAFPSVSGASFNPAVSVALSVSSGFTNFGYALFISTMNMLAPPIASVIFYLMAPEEYDFAKEVLPSEVIDESSKLLGGDVEC